MTISSTVRIAGPFIGTGTATVFPFAFKVFTATNLQVVRVDTSTGLESTLILNTDYTVSLNTDQDSNPGGNVTLLAVLAVGFNMVITSDIANLQPTDLTNQGGFYPEVITDALDRATIQIQQMADELTRSIKIPISDGLSLDMELPTAAARANSFLAFDATGEPTVVTAGSPGAPTTMTRQQFSGTGSQVAYTLASDPGALGNSCEVFVGGIYQQRDTYTIAGTTLTFTAAPVAGTNNIEVVNFLTTAIGTTDSSLVTYVPAGTSATQRTVQAKLRDVVSVKDFGAVGDGVTDDTAAVQACVDAAKNGINKTILIPAGTYLVTHIDMIGIAYSDISFIGVGMPTFVFKLPSGGRVIRAPYPDPTFARYAYADGIFCIEPTTNGSSSTDALSVKNISFYGIEFKMDVVTNGFDELMHCICATGTSGLFVDHCKFTGFMGDGIAVCQLRSITTSYQEYNQNFICQNSIFDGINKNNRQAISIYYCDGFTIQDNTFKNTTRPDMPGCIDIEPNVTTLTNRCGLIQRNTFNNIGNNGVTIYSTNTSIPVQNSFVICNNTFHSIYKFPLNIAATLPTGTKLQKLNVLFSYNACDTFHAPFQLDYVRGIKIENNLFKNSTINWGMASPYEYIVIGAADVDIIGNVFDGFADTTGMMMSLSAGANFKLINNTFNDFADSCIFTTISAWTEISGNTFQNSRSANPFTMFSGLVTQANSEYLRFSNNTLLNTYSSGSNGKPSINANYWRTGVTVFDFNSITPQNYDFGNTIFESYGLHPDGTVGLIYGTVVANRVKDSNATSVSQYWYPSLSTDYFVYYRLSASATTWNTWRKLSLIVL